MDKELAHTIVIGIAVLGITVLCALWILKGGDGVALTGYFTTVGALIGYEFGYQGKPAPVAASTTGQ